MMTQLLSQVMAQMMDQLFHGNGNQMEILLVPLVVFQHHHYHLEIIISV